MMIILEKWASSTASICWALNGLRPINADIAQIDLDLTFTADEVRAFTGSQSSPLSLSVSRYIYVYIYDVENRRTIESIHSKYF